MGRATEEKPAAEEELETSVIGNEKVNLDPVRLDTFSSGCDFQVDVLLTNFDQFWSLSENYTLA